MTLGIARLSRVLQDERHKIVKSGELHVFRQI